MLLVGIARHGVDEHEPVDPLRAGGGEVLRHAAAKRNAREVHPLEVGPLKRAREL